MEDFDTFEEIMENMALSYIDMEEVENLYNTEEYYQALEVDFDFDSEYDRYREF